MTKPLQTICMVLVLGQWSYCFAQRSPGWSFWGAADGMKESYTPSVAVHAGSVWIKHGTVAGMNVLYGYGLTEVTDPGAIGNIRAAPDGTLWGWTGKHLSRYRNSRWDRFDVDPVTGTGVLRSDTEQNWIFTSNLPPHHEARIWVVGVDAEHALILLPDQILEFDAIGKTSRVVLSSAATGIGSFTSMIRESKDNIWITGKHGLGAISSPDWRWHASVQPPAGYEDLEEPYTGDNGELLLTASDRSQKSTVLRLMGKRWEVVYQGESRQVKGWRGAENTVWIRDGNRLLHLGAGTTKTIPVERAGPLSGIVLSVKTDLGNRFWIGTSQGLAMYMPPLWRAPPETGAIDDVITAITEDKKGRVWFLSPHILICLDGEKWEFFPLPKGETAWSVAAEGLAVLGGDQIAIRTASTDLLTFDPLHRQFHNVKHPSGRQIRMMFPQTDGSLWVQTVAPGSMDTFAIETFDGRKFHPFLNPMSSGGISDLRSVVVDPNGEIWAGGSDGFVKYRKGTISREDARTGFTDTGAFYVKRLVGGRLLAGGRDGLFEYDGKRWHPILRGLDRARNVVEGRDGSLWIASGTGIHRLKDGNEISHGTAEGLPSDVAYRVFQDSRGRIWAGTTRGLSLFHPDADLDPPATKISADENAREVPPGGRTRLVFSGLDKWKFTPSDRLLFSWRMDGADWSSFANQTSVAIDKLGRGAHRFEVRSMDRNGNIDPHPAAHGFSVLPAWYETRAFQYLAGASSLIIGLLVAIALSNYRTLSQRKRLERDRQEILEMIARREPLEGILRQVVLAIAKNQRGAIGAALDHGNGVVHFLAYESAPARMTHICGSWSAGEEGVQRDLVFLGLKHGPTIQIRSGEQENLGAMVAIFPLRARQMERDSAALQALSGIASVAIENARLYDQLNHQAHHDCLTDLPNRVSVEAELQSALTDARKNGTLVAVLFLDIDRFKHINDSLGHRAGDSVLGQVAARLRQSIPDGAMAARTGGDEFTIIVKHQTEKGAIERGALCILQALQAPLIVEDNTLHPCASMGISMFPGDGEDAGTLQKHADLAMYRAKASGKNQHAFFSHEMENPALQAMATEQVLHRALDEQWFELHYQAQFNRRGDLSGMEALVRLNHPLFGLVGPNTFIGVSEETGLIHRLGEWVLREACRQIRRWQDAGFDPVKVAVNVSALQFHRPSFAELVGNILSEMEVDPRLIELELTESAIMGTYQQSASHMQELRTLGLSIALDDFGTGYSSLAHLRRLPIDVLKIDRSFVKEIDSRPGSSSLVQSIIALAHNLNLTVVAEGVETEYQHTALCKIDCDHLQGYLLHRPQLAAKLNLTQLGAELAVSARGDRYRVPQSVLDGVHPRA